jgi:predicted RNase H-like HicB family nuclease
MAMPGLPGDFKEFLRSLNSHRVEYLEYAEGVNLTIDLDREEDGRWIAEALEIPGVMCYGQTRVEAISNTERLAIEVITDRIAHGELPSSALGVSFRIADEQLARQ